MSKKVTVGYWYYLGVHFVVAHTVDAVRRILMQDRLVWSGDVDSNARLHIDGKTGLFGGKGREGGFDGEIDVMFGRAGQGSNDYLVEKAGNPQPAYLGVLSVVLRGCQISANNPYLKPFAFEVERYPAAAWYPATSTVGVDANPAHIIYDVLTDRDWGMGVDAATIDDASFRAAADTLHAEGLGLSLVWSANGSINDFVQEVLDHVAGLLLLRADTGQFALRLLRADYEAESLFVLDESNITELVAYHTRAWGETVNELIVNYTDRANQYRTSTVTAHDYGNLQMQGGIVSQKKDYRGAMTATLAGRLARRDLRALAAPLAKVELRVNRTAWRLNVGDVVRWSWAALEADRVCRVLRVDYGEPTDSAIGVELIDDVFAWGGELTDGQPSEQGGLEDPTPVPQQTLFEAPYWAAIQSLSAADLNYLPPDAIYALYCASQPSAGAYQYTLYTDSGSGYEQADAGQAFAPYATLAASIDRLDTVLTLTDRSNLDDVAVPSLAVIGNEMVRVLALADATLTVQRGALDTLPAPQAAGTDVWFWDDFAAEDPTQYGANQGLAAKALPQTLAGELAIAAAPAVSQTLNPRINLPYNVKNLHINGQYWPTVIGDRYTELALTWANTDRLQQTVQPPHWLSGSVGIEPGCQVYIRIYVPAPGLLGNDVLLRQVVTTNTSYTYPGDTERADGGLQVGHWEESYWWPGDPLHPLLRVEVRVVNGDGQSSWQIFNHTVARSGQ
jgi:hypothetical protein